MLPELDALGGLFEANEEWREDASAVRARMLGILSEVADRYVNLGATAFQLNLPLLPLPLPAAIFNQYAGMQHYASGGVSHT